MIGAFPLRTVHTSLLWLIPAVVNNIESGHREAAQGGAGHAGQTSLTAPARPSQLTYSQKQQDEITRKHTHAACIYISEITFIRQVFINRG